MVARQYPPDRSTRVPNGNRSTRASASPAPVTSPTSSAEAPSEASSGPVIERAPSYTMSAARETTPKPTTARHGDQLRSVEDASAAAGTGTCSGIGGAPPACSDTGAPLPIGHQPADPPLLQSDVVHRCRVARA